jgi:hypothetical protein
VEIMVIVYYFIRIALTKKLVDKVKKEWDDSIRRKKEEYASLENKSQDDIIFDGIKVQIDEGYIM